MEPDPERKARLYERPRYREITSRIAANARRLRAARGWTQLKTAVRAEMPTYLLQRVESGRFNVTTTTLARLCDAFEVDVAEFFVPAPALPAATRGRPAKAAGSRRRPVNEASQEPPASGSRSPSE